MKVWVVTNHDGERVKIVGAYKRQRMHEELSDIALDNFNENTKMSHLEQTEVEIED